jgi:hypothetical protein
MKRLLILLLFLSAMISAGDKTPYKFIFGGNSYYGGRNASVTWLAERYDCAIAGLADWPGMHDSIYDTALAMGKDFWCGPYASSQEINLYNRFDPGLQYNDRLANITDNWLYIYAKHYLDSIGVSAESLVVHISDDYVDISNAGDGRRSYSLTGLPLHKRRFSYQYWNNTASDTMFYPAGYCWLANGYNGDARKAIAYAYRRHLIEDSTAYGPGDHHWTAFFMDNQYRGGFAPRLYSYYDILGSTGGPTSGLDWFEQPGIGNDIPSNTVYYDYSTMRIDSTISAVLDSTCDANGLHRIVGFANVDKFSPQHLASQLRFTHVNLENPVDYAKAWPNGWAQWYAMADIMAAHPERYINWLFLGDFLCSSSPGDWRYDSSRIFMTHYAFFLQVRDTNAFCGPARYNDTTRWRDIYEVDLGEPDGPAYEVSSEGSNYNKIAVMRRDYDNGSAAVLVRTAHGGADYVNDEVEVNMQGLYREVNVHGDTSDVVDSVFYLKPYMGKVLLLDQGDSPTLSNFRPAGGVCYTGHTDTISFTVSAGHGIDSLCVWLHRPYDDTLLLDLKLPQGTSTYEVKVPYTWGDDDCGHESIAVYIKDGNGNVTYLEEAFALVVIQTPADIGDAVRIINYIFNGGPPPDPSETGDANCDGAIDIGDSLYIINHVFRGGPPICCPN